MRFTTPRIRTALLAVATLAVSLGPLAGIATSQVTKAGTASNVALSGALFGGIVRGTTSAHDTVNNVSLVVAAHGDVRAVFVNASGVPVTGHIDLWSVVSGFGQFPTVTFSPHLGGGAFLVTWNASTAVPPYVNTTYGRVVSYTQAGHVASAVFPLSDTPTFAEVGAAPAVAYSPTSQQFLVAWQAINYEIRGRLLSVGSLSAGPTFVISSGNAQYPGVAYNPTTNQFGVGYSGFGGSGAFNAFALVSATGSVVSRNTFNLAAGTFITDMAVNPTTGNYLMTWSQGDGTRAAEFSGNGTLLGMGPVSAAVGGYDSGSLSYSSTSGTFLVVGHGQTGEVAAAELSSRGNRISAVIEASTSAAMSGTFYPRVSFGQNRWLTTFSRDFTTAQTHTVTTTSASGGGNSALPAPGAPPPPPPGTPPPGTPPPPTGCTSPSPGSGWTCVNGGWLPPSGGGTTPPPSAGGCAGTAPFAGAVCQNGGWVPGTGGTGGGTGGNTGGCPGTAPFPGAVCQSGGWVPGTGGTGGGTGGNTGGCTTASPGAGWVCSNGGWLPPGSGGSTPPPPTSSCTSPSPGAGWVCSNGGWLPPGSGGSTPPPPTSSCTSPSPGAGWVCSNGGWLPPGSGGSTPPPPASSCTSPSPGAGWVCSNGGWLPPGSGGSTPPPPTSSCTSPSPGAGWVCSNGGWLPPGSGGSTPPPPTSTCTTPSPGSGWTCRNGGWLPPGIASADFTAMGTLAGHLNTRDRQQALLPAPLRSAVIDHRLL